MKEHGLLAFALWVELKDTSEISSKLFNDILLEAASLYLRWFLLGAVAAIRDRLRMRETVEAAVALGLCRYVLKVVHTAAKKSADLVLKVLTFKNAKPLRKFMFCGDYRHEQPRRVGHEVSEKQRRNTEHYTHVQFPRQGKPPHSSQ
jgi:hypothetical protein